jgi:hypothetical protein
MQNIQNMYEVETRICDNEYEHAEYGIDSIEYVNLSNNMQINMHNMHNMQTAHQYGNSSLHRDRNSFEINQTT